MLTIIRKKKSNEKEILKEKILAQRLSQRFKELRAQSELDDEQIQRILQRFRERRRMYFSDDVSDVEDKRKHELGKMTFNLNKKTVEVISLLAEKEGGGYEVRALNKAINFAHEHLNDFKRFLKDFERCNDYKVIKTYTNIEKSKFDEIHNSIDMKITNSKLIEAVVYFYQENKKKS
ncbi:hypothetical protein [Thermococcus sp. GR6]|uniref:hypothetical protein n=1 Tax=Thermococcus sp. GR6 TaxID=1638256 RepID=UPI001981F198|nr:hypothetical protein [Thermococcus sp. GR6]